MTQEIPNVHVIATGGSISCIGRSRLDLVNYSDDNNRLAIADMLARIPEVAEFAKVSSEQLANVSGGGLTPSDWLTLARRANEIWKTSPDIAGIVVTHGTATLEETAYFLSLASKSEKPIAVTGAMRPPSALSTDADLNLVDCIRVAAAPQSIGMGALVVFNNEIHSAREVSKTHTSRVHAFRSPDFGCLGYADTDQSVVYYRTPVRAHTHRSEFDLTDVSTLPRVEIVMAYAGADGACVDLSLTASATVSWWQDWAAATSQASFVLRCNALKNGVFRSFWQVTPAAVEPGTASAIAKPALSHPTILRPRRHEFS